MGTPLAELASSVLIGAFSCARNEAPRQAGAAAAIRCAFHARGNRTWDQDELRLQPQHAPLCGALRKGVEPSPAAPAQARNDRVRRRGTARLLLAGDRRADAVRRGCVRMRPRLRGRDGAQSGPEPGAGGRRGAGPAAVGDGPDQIGVDDYAYSELGFAPGFIKVDVDGGELAVLRSASRVLSERHPALIVETHSRDMENDSGRRLVGHGYRPLIVNQRRLFAHKRDLDFNRWLVAS